jgi:7-cyano-7-deazaguanine synthase
LQNFELVVAVGFDYGQKHKKELEQAQKIADLAGVPYHLFNMQGLVGGSSLTDQSQSVNDAHRIDSNLPSSFTAGRNALFLTIAASFAYNLKAHHVVTGVCETDYSGYPDCRQQFINALEHALDLAMDSSFTIHTPLMQLTKAETWKLAADLRGEYNVNGRPEYIDVVEVVRTMTLTDYNGDMTQNAWGMGKEDNPASILRAKGYNEAVQMGWV